MAILRNRRTCSTAVVATIIVGSGNSSMRAASNLTNANLKGFSVNRTSCTQPSSSQHNQPLNSKILANTHLIGGQGQASDPVVLPHQEPGDGDIELCIDRGRTSTQCTKKDLTRYSSLVITKSL